MVSPRGGTFLPFAVTVFLAAFLLFVVQLILSKFILPWFGGVPAVWTTCMLFFQSLLLLGYAYAHWSGTRLPPARQGWIHLVLLAGSLVVIAWLWGKWGSPILPGDNWKPSGPEQPIHHILRLLAVSIGLPFFLLAASSPLLQRWFSFAPNHQQPYRLYAWSNAGSLLGLLAYPFLIEPWLRVSTQAQIWGLAYGIFVLACAGRAVMTVRNAAIVSPRDPTRSSHEPKPPWLSVLIWLLLAGVASSLLLAVTNNLCQDIAVVPFLWVLPLAIYLLSFILCFASDRWYHRGAFVMATSIASLVALATGFQGARFPLLAQVTSHSVLLFLFCMTCHGELARAKPSPRHLTLFYLMLALGGMLGGVFVGLIAPVVFSGYREFPVGLLAGWLVLAAVFVRDPASGFHRGDRWQFAGMVLLSSYVALDRVLEFTPLRHLDLFMKYSPTFTLVGALLLTGGAVIGFRRRPLARSPHWPRVLVGTVILAGGWLAHRHIQRMEAGTVEARRNFYGIVRVMQSNLAVNGQAVTVRQLTHGQVNHGIQILAEPWRTQPVSYYARDSGVELAFRLHPRRQDSASMTIGVLGLGVGTIAAFARAEDTVRFYEINPAVRDLCTGPSPRFTYLAECAGRADIVMGDARLALTRELQDNQSAQFDILVMDAFSGDSVPVHLLTTEAFAVYLEHLRDHTAIIAINISNQYLDLSELVFSLARHYALHAAVIHSPGQPPDHTPSRWAVLTRDPEFLQQPPIPSAREPDRKPGDIFWTDDFSNLLQLLR